MRYAALFKERVGHLILASTGAWDGGQLLAGWDEFRQRERTIDLSFLDDPSMTDAQKTRKMAFDTAPLDVYDQRSIAALHLLLSKIEFSGE